MGMKGAFLGPPCSAGPSHGKFGLDSIALTGQWHLREHRRVLEMHQALLARGISIAERSATQVMHRYEELVALRIADQERSKTLLQKQSHVMLALDGLQPDQGHEVLWIVRDASPKKSCWPARSSAGGRAT